MRLWENPTGSSLDRPSKVRASARRFAMLHGTSGARDEVPRPKVVPVISPHASGGRSMSKDIQEVESQTFVETALKLGGKSEDEARRTGAIDRADDQVEALFATRYQTANSPVHRAVWDQAFPVELFQPRAAGRPGRMRTGDGRVDRRRPPPSRRPARCSTPTARSPSRCSRELADAGLLGPAGRPGVRRAGAPVRRVRPVPDADGDDRSDGRRPGLGPRLHRRGRSGADVRQRRAEAAIPARAGQRRAALARSR